MTHTYTTEGDVEKYLQVDIGGSLGSWVQAAIDAAGDWIDQYCGRTFEPIGSQARVFDSEGGTYVSIDPARTITSVEILDAYGDVSSTLGADDYRTWPYQDSLNGEPRPATRLILTPGSGIGRWPDGDGRVRVTGTWGYASVPGAIKQACTILVSRWIEKGLKGGKLSAETLGDLKLDFQEIQDSADVHGVYQLLSLYRNVEL